MDVRRILLAVTLLTVAGAATAAPYEFAVSFTSTSEGAFDGGGNPAAADDFSALLGKHFSGSNAVTTAVTGFENVDTAVQYTGQANNYSALMYTTLNLAVPAQYEFQVGADWGRGGGIALLNNAGSGLADHDVVQEVVRYDNIWWNNSWSNSDVISQTYNISTPGTYTVAWVGFENCCAGTTTVRFAVDGGAFMMFNEANIAPFTASAISTSVVPLPPSGVLLAAVTGLLVLRLRPSNALPIRA